MKFTDYHILNEAGFKDRIKFLAQKYENKWRLRMMELANTELIKSQFPLVMDLQPEIVKLADIQKSGDHGMPGLEGGYEPLSNLYANRAKDSTTLNRQFWKQTKAVHELLANAVKEAKQGLHDDKIGTVNSKDSYQNHYGSSYKRVIMELSMAVFENITDEYDITKEFEQIASVADPVVAHQLQQNDPLERTKPVYLEWLILSCIEGAWNKDIEQEFAQNGHEFSSFRSDWTIFVDLPNYRELLEKHWYYTTREQRRVNSHASVANQTRLAHEDGEDPDDLLHRGLYTPDNPTDILQFKPIQPYHPEGGYYQPANRLYVLAQYIDEIEHMYPNMERPGGLKGKQLDEVDGVKKVGENDLYVALELQTAEAATLVCKGMGWCVSDPGTFQDYAQDGPMVAFVEKESDGLGSAKYLLHAGSHQAKARFNQQMDIDEVGEIADIVIDQDAVPGFNEIIQQSLKEKSPKELKYYYDHFKDMKDRMSISDSDKAMHAVMDKWSGDPAVKDKNSRLAPTPNEVVEQIKMLMAGEPNLANMAYDLWAKKAQEHLNMSGSRYSEEWMAWSTAVTTMDGYPGLTSGDKANGDYLRENLIMKSAGFRTNNRHLQDWGQPNNEGEIVPGELTLDMLVDTLLSSPNFVVEVWGDEWLSLFNQPRTNSGNMRKSLSPHLQQIGSELRNPLDSLRRALSYRLAAPGGSGSDLEPWVDWYMTMNQTEEEQKLMDFYRQETNTRMLYNFTDDYIRTAYRPWIQKNFIPLYEGNWEIFTQVRQDTQKVRISGVAMMLALAGLPDAVKGPMKANKNLQAVVDMFNLKRNILTKQPPVDSYLTDFS